jgi:Mn2+/Fe2+ NRAMP family transporter
MIVIYLAIALALALALLASIPDYRRWERYVDAILAVMAVFYAVRAAIEAAK